MEFRDLKLEQVPFFRVFLFFTLGILVSFHVTWDYAYFQGLALLILILFFLLLLYCWIKKPKKLHLLSYALLFLLGMFILALQLPKEKLDVDDHLKYCGNLLG